MTALTRIAYQRLYKNHGKSIGYWEGWVEAEGGQAHIVLQHARTMDGQVVRKLHPVVGKNIGKSNETTQLEQAQLELDSRAKKQLDKGYVKRIEDASAPSTNSLGLKKPMLAQPMDKVDADKIDWSTAWAQPKLDGHRAMNDGILYSRNGKEIKLPHIVDAIKLAKIDHLHLDGELYLHGKTLQEIGSLVKRQQPESLGLTYYVYDIVGEGAWYDRTREVADLLFRLGGSVKFLTAFKVNNPEELQAFHEENLRLGFEGTMLRWGTEGYQDGKRSKYLLKMKNFVDAEFKIIGVEEGVPYIKDGKTYRVPVWVCEVGNGKVVKPTAQGDMHQKNHLWETQDEHIGKMLTIKYHYLSADGIPQIPVSKCFRDEL